MKVTISVEFDVEPEKELSGKEKANVNGMLTRMTRHRLEALLERRLGGGQQDVGWEVMVKGMNVSATSKLK
jgi:hypothetical protein